MNNLAMMMYTEIDIICVILLLYIAIKSFKNIERRQSWLYMQYSVCFVILFACSDLLWNLIENHVVFCTRPVAYLINSFYYMCAVGATATWFLYTESELDTGHINEKYFKAVSSIPALILFILLIASYQNGILFFIDDEMNFHRGPLNLLAFAIPCFYLILSVVHSLSRALIKENYVNKKQYLNLAQFSLTPTVCCTLQILLPGTPLPCIGIAAGMLLVYMNSQELLVSLDPLTKLNNRYNMVRYLSDKMEHINEGHTLHLLMIDLDKFKMINDTYGHVEGDKALVMLAGILKEAASKYKCFAARYGGDEFIMVYETTPENGTDELCEYICERLEKLNQISKKDYSLQISIGHAEYQREIRYIPEFIAIADHSLYAVKQKKKCH